MKVLIVDDDSIMIQYLTESLICKINDIDIEGVTSAEDCLELIQKEKYDILLVDHIMPGMNGLELIKKIMNLNYNVPIIFLTGYGDINVAIQALKYGAVDYINKNKIEIDELALLLKDVYNKYSLHKLSTEKYIPEVYNVLYIEHDENDIELTVDYIKRQVKNINLTAVKTANEAFQLLENKPFDVILIDLLMPELNGIEIFKKLKTSGYDKPVIILTGSTDEESAITALKLGVYDYIIKRKNYLLQLPSAIEHAYAIYKLKLMNEEKQNQIIELNKKLEEALIKTYEEKVKAEQQLILTKERFKDLFYSNPIPMLIIDERTQKFIEVNDEAVKYYGYTRDEFLKISFKEICLDENYSELISSNDEVSVITNLCTQKKKNGDIIFAEIKSNLLEETKEHKLKLIAVYDLTEKIKLEEELKEEKELFRTLADTTTTAIFVYKGEHFVYVNKAVQRISGYSEDELLNMKFWDIVHPEFRDLVKQRGLERQQGKDIPSNYEFKIICKDGTEKWLDFTAGVIKWKGEIASIGTAFDITERKKAEEEVKRNEERYKLFFHNDISGDFEFKPDGTILICNDSLVKILKYDNKEEILNKNVKDFFASGEIRESLFEEIQKYGRVQNRELELIAKDGSIVNVIENVVGVFDDNNNLEKIVGYIFEITERKKAENELRKSEEKFRKMFETANEGIMIVDENNLISTVNKKMADMLGYKINEIIGNKVTSFLPEEEIESFLNEIEKRKKGELAQLERKFVKKDGSIIYTLISASPFIDDEGNYKGSFAMITDITERKKMELDLILAKEKAEDSDKMKSLFLAQMSHEFRTPLHTILSYLSLLHEDLTSRNISDIDFYFNSIDSASRRLIRTVDMILNMSQLQVGFYKPNFKEINLIDDIIKKVINDFITATEEKNLYIKLLPKTKEIKILGDEYSLIQLFANLIDNAIKYTKEGGIIITVFNKDNNLCVSIEDTGIGIAKEYLPKLFEPFSQESTGYTRAFDGVGLGMSLVKEYCKINGAEIHVESEKNVGTKITIIFNRG
ncbi:MAG: PAS domain S-box protein [Melioribacteraceae bacterium]